MISNDAKVSALGVRGVDVFLRTMTKIEAEPLASAFSEMSPWNRYPFPPDALLKYFTTTEAGAPRFAVCLDDPSMQAIGALGLRENWLRGPYIQFLGLVAPYQNRRIGEALLHAVESHARQLEAENLWVMASHFNDRAQDFYRRSGFFPVAKIDALVVADHSEILFRKRLD